MYSNQYFNTIFVFFGCLYLNIPGIVSGVQKKQKNRTKKQTKKDGENEDQPPPKKKQKKFQCPKFNAPNSKFK